MFAINNKELVPLGIYQARYRTLDVGEISRRTGVPFDPARGAFVLSVLGFTIYAAWPEFSLVPEEKECCAAILYGGEATILMIRYLSEGTRTAPGDNWLSYRELPWGEVYDKNFQGRCIKRLAFGFGSKPGVFAGACEKLGGTQRDKGDISYDLPFLPDITVRLILWAGDDEFPPQSQWLFSDNTPFAFSAEDVAVIGDVVIGALKEMATNTSS